MTILYPANYKETVKAERVLDTTKVKNFIKGLVKNPMDYSDIIKKVDAEYVRTKDEGYHLLAEEIGQVCAEIDAEWHPVVEAVEK